MVSTGFKQVKENGFPALSQSGFFRGLGLSLGLTFSVFLISALLLTYTPLPESSIPFISLGTLLVSMMLAGAVAAKKVGHHGYLSGALAGLTYSLLLYLASMMIAGEWIFGSYVLVLLLIGVFGGAVGGILGINFAPKKRR